VTSVAKKSLWQKLQQTQPQKTPRQALNLSDTKQSLPASQLGRRIARLRNPCYLLGSILNFWPTSSNLCILQSAGKLPLAMGDNVVRQTSSGHSQIRVSRIARCEYTSPAD